MNDGVLLVVKPPGCSSQDIAHAMRRLLGAPCGHLGTLDPLAAGLMVVAAGRATRLVRYAEGREKEYVAEIWLGLGTASQDFAEPPAARADAGWLTLAGVESAIAAEQQKTMQRPPDFSARQVGGERAYHAARQGRRLDLPERPARLLEAEVLAFRPGEVARVRVRLVVSSGYYVRSLARDLGQRLHLPGVLAALVRTASGPYRLAAARTLEEEPQLLPMDKLVDHLPAVELGPAEGRRLAHGQRLPLAGERRGLCAAYVAGRLVAVVDARDGVFHPETVLAMED